MGLYEYDATLQDGIAGMFKDGFNDRVPQNSSSEHLIHYSSRVFHQTDTFRPHIYIAAYVYHKGRWPGVGSET